jgi:hypothetical protein
MCYHCILASSAPTARGVNTWRVTEPVANRRMLVVPRFSAAKHTSDRIADVRHVNRKEGGSLKDVVGVLNDAFRTSGAEGCTRGPSSERVNGMLQTLEMTSFSAENRAVAVAALNLMVEGGAREASADMVSIPILSMLPLLWMCSA